MKRILFYGNCQMLALMKVTGLQGQYICCYETQIKNEDFNSIIKSCDIIFTQMIKDDYHNKFYLSTSNVIKEKKEDCKVFICANNYMKFYYFDSFTSKTILKPTPYHYFSLIKYKTDIEYIKNNIINNIDFKNIEDLNKIVNNDIQELIARENIIKKKYTDDNIYYIFTSEFIKNNYKDKLLFWTINHPTKYILQYMAKQISNTIKIKINYIIDPLQNDIKQILYKSVEKLVHFNIDNYTSNYNLDNYIKSYIDSYSEETTHKCLEGLYESR